MKLYTAVVELKTPGAPDAVAAYLAETLAGYQIDVSSTGDGWISAQLRLVGSSLAQATQMATDVIGQVSGLEPAVCHVMSETEFVRRRVHSATTQCSEPGPEPAALTLAEAGPTPRGAFALRPSLEEYSPLAP